MCSPEILADGGISLSTNPEAEDGRWKGAT